MKMCKYMIAPLMPSLMLLAVVVGLFLWEGAR